MKLKKRPRKNKGNQHSLGYSLPKVFAFSKITFQALREASDVVKVLEVHQMNFQSEKYALFFIKYV